MVWLRIKRTLRALPKWQLAVLAMFFGWLFLTLFGPYLAPFPTEVAEPTTRLLPPSGTYPFGTDENGIDIFSRVLAAPRTDVVIGVVATAISVLLGAPLGVIVALYESRGGAGSTAFAETFMRVLEVIQSFPVFVFAMVLVAVFGGSVTNIIIAIAFVNTPVFVRIVRSDVLTLVQRPFAEAARAVGNREVRIGFRHVLPNALPTVLVQVSVTVGFAILLTAGLSFVGAGVKPPTAELGAMIASGAKYLELGQWWAAFFPGVTLGLIVFSFGIFGEIMTRVMEPRAVRRDTDRRREAALETGGDEPEVPEAPTLALTRLSEPVLAVEHLGVAAVDTGQPLLSEIHLALEAGHSMGIVGESGSGKSVLVKTLLQLLPPELAVTSGSVRYLDHDLLTMSKGSMRAMRTTQIAAILPNAKSAAEPAHHRRRHAAQRATGAREDQSEGRRGPGDPALGDGGYRRPGAAAECLPPRAERRHGPAGVPRHGADVPAQAAHRGRAHRRARRDHPAPGARPHPRAGRGCRHGAPPHHRGPRYRRALLRHGGSDAGGADRRDQ